MNKKILPWYILSIAIIFYCYEFFLRISPSIVIPQLMIYFNTTPLGIGLLAFAYYFAYTIGQLPGGFLLDRYPIEWVLGAATAICALASYLFIVSHFQLVAICSRFIIGLASSVSFTGVLNLAERYLPAQYFTLVAGIAISLATLAASYAQTITTHLLSHYHWSILFYGSAALGLVLSIFICLSLRVINTQQRIFCPEEKYFVHLRKIIFNKYLWLNGIMGGLFYLPTSIFAAVWGVQFLQTNYHLTNVSSTHCISNLFLGWMIGSPIVGYFVEKKHCERWLLQIGSISMAVLILLILYIPGFIRNHLFFTFLLFGLLSSTQVVVWKFFKYVMPLKFAGFGIAMTTMIITLTIACGQLLMGYLLQLSTTFSPLPSVIDYKLGLLVLPFLLCLGIIIIHFLPGQPKVN